MQERWLSVEEIAPPRATVSCILETFPIMKRKDEIKWGDNRIQRTTLEIYDVLSNTQRRAGPASAAT